MGTAPAQIALGVGQLGRVVYLVRGLRLSARLLRAAAHTMLAGAARMASLVAMNYMASMIVEMPMPTPMHWVASP